MSADSDSARDAWSAYWQSGSLHSCPGSFGQGYEGCIGEFWRQLVPQMQEHHRVLDVGTGNGPLPRLIVDQCDARAPRIDAIDIARVKPDWWDPRRYPRVHFHAGVGADRTPFESGSFDWLVSQYGFEYAPRPEAIAECQRVLAQDGRVAMVLHHRDSVVCRVGAAELGHHRFLSEESGLFPAADRLVPYFARIATQGPQSVRNDPAASDARQRYNAAMNAVAQRIETSPHAELLDEARRNVHAVVCAAGSRSSEWALASLRDYAGQLQAAQVRTIDMLEHALDEADVSHVGQALAAARPAADIDYRTLRQSEGLLGWALQIR